MNSVWTESVELPIFRPLNRDLKTDVLIIGGGMAGLLILDRLTKLGCDCTLVEADTICSGITKNTTAKITSQHGLIYADLLRRYGEHKAYGYMKVNEEAIYEYRKLC